MKDRLITLLGGLFALYIVIALLSPPTQPDYLSRPLTTDRDQHGLALLFEWLGKNNIPLHALRQRYDDIQALAKIPEAGNIMLINLPFKIDARKEEMAQLRRWIAQGNTVLILTAHSDIPDWATANRSNILYSKFPLLTSLGFNIDIDVETNENDESTEEDDKAGSLYQSLKSPTPVESSLDAAGINNPSLKSISVRQSRLNDVEWTLSSRERARGSRVLFTDAENKKSPALWQVRIGSGNVIISRYTDLFSNYWLTKGDHARLFDTVLQQHRSEAGYVLFDDMHQGLTELYDPDAFYSDSRLHNTLWFLFGFWLLYLVGRSNRLAPPSKIAKKAHAADFIRAIGGLFARRISNATTAQGLIRAFFNEIRQQYHLPVNGQPIWTLLEDAPRISNNQLLDLQTAYKKSQQNKKQNLVKLHNQLRETRKSLL